MKYGTQDYTAAFLQAIEGMAAGVRDERIRRFVHLLARNGDIGQGAKIITETQRRLVRRTGGRWIAVQSAWPLDREQEEQLRKMFGATDHIEYSVRPSLGAGVRVTVDGSRELDATLAGKLKNLFP